MSEYSLRLFARTGSGALWHTSFVEDLTDKAKGWRRSIRLQGGPWQGSFRIAGPAKDLLGWFYERLGWHVEERSGGQTTWEGLVYEMDLSLDGITRRRSLNTMTNAVISAHYHPEAVWEKDTPRYTTDPVSIAHYGRKEEVASGSHLKRWAAAPMQPQSFSWSDDRKVSGEGELTVTVCGYAFTMNWLFSSVYWLAPYETSVSDALINILHIKIALLAVEVASRGNQRRPRSGLQRHRVVTAGALDVQQDFVAEYIDEINPHLRAAARHARAQEILRAEGKRVRVLELCFQRLIAIESAPNPHVVDRFGRPRAHDPVGTVHAPLAIDNR